MAEEQINSKNPRKQLVDSIIESMQTRDGVWQKTWSNISQVEAPHNPITGKKYNGVNLLVLSLEQTRLDTLDSRWCTFKQAVNADYKIIRGSKATQAIFYDLSLKLKDQEKEHIVKAKSVDEYISKIANHYQNKYPNKQREIENTAQQALQHITKSYKAQFTHLVSELNKVTNANIEITTTAIMKSFPIFNYSQMENVPALEIKELPPFQPIARADGILLASGAKIFHDNANMNFYIPKTHEIHLTPRESFYSPEAYYSTALHELAHWTEGDGLMRNVLPCNFKVDRELDNEHLTYAREELRAELASVFLSSDLSLKLDIQNHAAYLGSYLKLLKDDYTEFFAAANDAQKIANHVLGFEKRLDLNSEQAKDLQLKNPELYQKIVEYKDNHALITDQVNKVSQIDKADDFNLTHSNEPVVTQDNSLDTLDKDITEIVNNSMTHDDTDYSR